MWKSVQKQGLFLIFGIASEFISAKVHVWLQILVMSHKRIHKQQASKASAAHQQEQEQTIDITEIMAQQEQQQPLEQTNEGSLQFVDSMGFVNILVLTEQDILNKLPKCD